MQLANVLLMIVQYALFVVAFRSISREQLTRLAGVVGVTAVLAAAYTLYQIAAANIGLPTFDWFRTSNLYLRINTLVPGGAGGWAGYPRAFGVAPEPSFWGGYLAFTIGFVLWRDPWRVRPRDLLASGLLLAAIAVTFSRSAWFTATVVTALAALTWLPRGLPRVLVPAIAAGLIVLMVWPLVIGDEVLAAFSDASAIGRVASQRTGWQMVLESPVLGTGLGSAEFFSERHAVYLPGQGDFQLHFLYNCYLLVLVSTGILGFGLFGAYLLKLADSIGAALRVPVRSPDVRRLQVGAAVAYTASLGFWSSTPAYNVTFVWFAFALASTLPRTVAPQVTSPPTVVPRENPPEAVRREHHDRGEQGRRDDARPPSVSDIDTGATGQAGQEPPGWLGILRRCKAHPEQIRTGSVHQGPARHDGRCRELELRCRRIGDEPEPSRRAAVVVVGIYRDPGPGNQNAERGEYHERTPSHNRVRSGRRRYPDDGRHRQEGQQRHQEPRSPADAAPPHRKCSVE
jgi:O-antigen ligase